MVPLEGNWYSVENNESFYPHFNSSRGNHYDYRGPQGKAYLYPDNTCIWKKKPDLSAKQNRPINKYELPFDTTHTYFTQRLQLGNVLSQLLIKLIDFRKGHFFTLLPPNAHFDRLLDFPEGGIIDPVFQNESEQCIPVVDEECSLFIHTYLQESAYNSVYFEDKTRESNDPFVRKNKNSLFAVEDEVYFALNNANNNHISTLLIATDQVWHSLCALSPWHPPLHNGDNEDLLIAAAHTQHLITSAYDSESYIFWEKNSYQGDCKTLFS